MYLRLFKLIKNSFVLCLLNLLHCHTIAYWEEDLSYGRLLPWVILFISLGFKSTLKVESNINIFTEVKQDHLTLTNI